MPTHNPQSVTRNSSLHLDKGVTLIELVMVIVIVGILAAVTIPRFGSFYFLKFTSAMKKTASDIRYIQQLAVSRHNDTRIEFNAAGNSYQSCYCNEADGSCVTGSCGSLNWPWITNPFTRGNLQVNFNSDPQYGGIDISAVDFGGTSTLRFNWQGTPQNANGVNLSGGDGTVSFSYKGSANTIAVTANTGRARIL
jgi:prepilin-type N-terminal cleavage/methylation domain-containing protein